MDTSWTNASRNLSILHLNNATFVVIFVIAFCCFSLNACGTYESWICVKEMKIQYFDAFIFPLILFFYHFHLFFSLKNLKTSRCTKKNRNNSY